MENLNEVTGFVPSLLKPLATFMNDGGVIMWVILCIWCLGVAISLERIRKLFSFDIDSTSLMNLVKEKVLLNEVGKAIELCSKSKALLPQVLKAGLQRANQTKEQIQDAVEASMLSVLPKLEKRLNYLALFANISTLIGLLGTIQGLIESFAAVANADPAAKGKLLALGISKAMNTTAFGLISAISIMVIHSVLTNKSEKISSDIEENAVKLVDLLGTKKRSSQLSGNSDKQAG